MRKVLGIVLAVLALAAALRLGTAVLSRDGGCQAGADPVPDGAPPEADRPAGGLWVINVDRRGETKLDGSRIAFGEGGDGSLSVVNVDGSGRRRLVGDTIRNWNKFGYAWSRDSRRIAFEAHGGYYGTWLGVLNAEGRGLRRIARHCAGTGPASSRRSAHRLLRRIRTAPQ